MNLIAHTHPQYLALSDPTRALIVTLGIVALMIAAIAYIAWRGRHEKPRDPKDDEDDPII